MLTQREQEFLLFITFHCFIFREELEKEMKAEEENEERESTETKGFFFVLI